MNTAIDDAICIILENLRIPLLLKGIKSDGNFNDTTIGSLHIVEDKSAECEDM